MTISQSHHEWLVNRANTDDTHQELASFAILETIRLESAFPEIRTPCAAIGPDGQIGYTWDSEFYHLEMEFFRDEGGTIRRELFWHNHATGQVEDADIGRHDEYPGWFSENLNRFPEPPQ